MRLKISIAMLSLFATILSGCYEDKGNYDYSPVNELEITLPDVVEAMAHSENIKFSPSIVSKISGEEISADDPNYEFLCRIFYSKIVDGISQPWYDINPEKKKDIDFYVDAPAGSYELWYTVKDKTTGVEYHAKSRITLISELYEGWMVLANNGAENIMRLDMIYTDSKGRELVAKGITGDKVTGLTEGFQVFLSPSKTTLFSDCVYLLSRSGAYKLYDNMEISASNDMRMLDFIMPDFPGSVQTVAQIHDGWRYGPLSFICVTTEGHAYGFTDNKAGTCFEYPLNSDGAKGTPKYKVAPAIGASMVRDVNSVAELTTTALFYDITNKRFLGWYYYAKDNKHLTPLADDGEGQPQGLFSFNTGMEFVDMDNTRFSNGLVYTVLQDNTGHRHVYGINMSGTNNIIKESAYDNLSGENFDTASDYVFHSQYPYMFYCKDNKVYSHGLTNNRTLDMITLENNEKITKLKFNLYGNMELDMLNKWDNEDFRNMQYRLIVCSTTGTPDGGIVRFYDIDSNGKMTLYKEYKGLGENIVDVTYRERRR